MALVLAVALLFVRLDAKPAFDGPVVAWLNQWVRRWPAVDFAAVAFLERHTLKGFAIMACALGAFAANRALQARMALVVGMAAVCAGAIFTRVGQKLLPDNLRPAIDPDARFVLPLFDAPDILIFKKSGWSSYPSDTMGLLFGLAAAVFLADRRWGMAALAIAVVGGVARIYTGRHYPTDIVGGALIGSALACAAAAAVYCYQPSEKVQAMLLRHQAWFVAGGFYVAVQVGMLFEEARGMAAQITGVFF